MDKLLFDLRKWLYKQRRNLNTMIIYLASAILVVILIVVYNSFYKPLKTTYKEQLDNIYYYTNNISMLPELSLSSEIMNSKVNDIEDIYTKLNDIVPDRRNVPFVTSQISLAAEGNSVITESMNKVLETTVTLGEDTFDVVKYNLVCFSEYDNIVNFLSTLETSNSIFAIEKVVISPLSDEEFEKYSEYTYVKANLDINIYMKSN